MPKRLAMLAFCALSLLSAIGQTCAQNVPLQWKLVAGDRQSYRMKQEAHLDLRLGADNRMQTSMRRVLDLRRTIQDIYADGSAQFSLEVLRVQLTVEGPDEQPVQYDSQASEEPRGFAATLTPLFQTLLETKLAGTITPSGEITDLQIPEKLALILAQGPTGKTFGKTASANDLTMLASLGLTPLPSPEKLSIGHLWQQSQTIAIAPLGPCTASTTYQLEKIRTQLSSKFAIVRPDVTVTLGNSSEHEESSVAIDEQSSSGEIVFDLTAGRLESSQIEQKITLRTRSEGSEAIGTLDQLLEIHRLPPAKKSPSTAAKE